MSKYHRIKDLLDKGYATNRTQVRRLIDQGIIPPPTYIGCTPVWTDDDLAEVDARLRAERDARLTPLKPRPRRQQAAAEPLQAVAPATPEPAPPPPPAKRPPGRRRKVPAGTPPDAPPEMVCTGRR